MQTLPGVLSDAEVRSIIGRVKKPVARIGFLLMYACGLRISEAGDGTAMHAALAAGGIELVILDLMLPGEDGLSLCRSLRAHSALPVIMLTAPIPATEKALWRSGLTLSDIGVFEVNEAFATVPLAWLAETGADPKRLNPHGGAIALGHPLGGSGARLMTTMIHHMRNTRTRYGLQTMCEGGGQANATILELL